MGSICIKNFFLDLIYSNNSGTVRMPDGIGMKHSLEIRSPFLNHRIVEFMLTLPTKFLLGNFKNKNKLIVKKIAEKYLPRKIIYARKMGFGYSVGPLVMDKIEYLVNKNLSKEIVKSLILKEINLSKINNKVLFGLNLFQNYIKKQYYD